MSKKLAIVIFSIIAIAIIVAVSYLKLNRLPLEQAKSFLSAINENNMSKIESFLSDEFKDRISKEQLADYLILNDFLNHKESNLSVVNDAKYKDKKVISGTIINSDGSASPIKIVLKKEGNEWKIYSIEKKLTQKELVKKSKMLQAKQFYLQLARVNLHYLAQALHDNNMTSFYKHISKKWQEKTTTKKLEENYGVLQKKKLNLLALDKAVPVLTKIDIAKDNLLTIKGYYKIAKSKKRLYFVEKFINENKRWALVALGIVIR